MRNDLRYDGSGFVDYTVFQMVNYKDFKSRIKLKEFAYTRQGNVVLEYDLVRRFLELLERNFQKERKYDFRHGRKTKDGLKKVQEITITKIIVHNLGDFCIGKRENFLFSIV